MDYEKVDIYWFNVLVDYIEAFNGRRLPADLISIRNFLFKHIVSFLQLLNSVPKLGTYSIAIQLLIKGYL